MYDSNIPDRLPDTGSMLNNIVELAGAIIVRKEEFNRLVAKQLIEKGGKEDTVKILLKQADAMHLAAELIFYNAGG